MNSKRLVAIVAVAGLCFWGSAAEAAAENEEMTFVDIGRGVMVPVTPMTVVYSPKVERPAFLPALYVSLGAMQAWDIYSTRAAVQAGAREANPIALASTRHTASIVGLKAVTTASTIFFAERMWKKSRVGAVVMLVAINGATAAVSMHNMRNAKALSKR